MPADKERNYSLDILRVLACIAVLSYHLPKESAVLKAADYCLITPALVVFFMLTGYLTGAPDPSGEGLYSYYKKKLIHLGMPLCLFTIFYSYIYFQHPSDLFTADGARYVFLGIKQSVTGVFAGPAINQMWFLYDILAVYLIWPFVRAGLDAIGEKGRRKLLALIMFLQLVISLYFLKTGSLPYFRSVIYLTGWILYPILGYIARDERPLRYDAILWAVGAVCIVLNAAMSITEAYLGASPDAYSFSPLMLIEGLAIFRAFLRIRVRGGAFLKFLSERTFTAYLLGAYTTFLLEARLPAFFMETVPGMILTLVILVIVTFLAAVAADLLILRYIERFLFFIVGSLERLFTAIREKTKD